MRVCIQVAADADIIISQSSLLSLKRDITASHFNEKMGEYKKTEVEEIRRNRYSEKVEYGLVVV